MTIDDRLRNSYHKMGASAVGSAVGVVGVSEGSTFGGLLAAMCACYLAKGFVDYLNYR